MQQLKIYLEPYFSTVFFVSWYRFKQVRPALIRLFRPDDLSVLRVSGAVTSYPTKWTPNLFLECHLQTKVVIIQQGILQSMIYQTWQHNITCIHRTTSQNFWHPLLHAMVKVPDVNAVPLLMMSRIPWNSCSRFSHCDDAELMSPPSFSSGYMTKCLRSSIRSWNPSSPSPGARSSIALTPQR